MPDSIEYEVIQVLHARINELIAQRGACLAVLGDLCAKQQYFSHISRHVNDMPRNKFYSDFFMAVVRDARAAIELCKPENPMHDEGPDSPAETARRKEIESRMPSRERMTEFVARREAAIVANGGRDPWLDDSEDMPEPPGHPDDASSVPLYSLRPGAILSTATGWRGIKSESGLCCSYDDGSLVSFDPATPCWEIRLGGWPPRNALPDPEKGTR